jgi:hypothetical protein
MSRPQILLLLISLAAIGGGVFLWWPAGPTATLAAPPQGGGVPLGAGHPLTAPAADPLLAAAGRLREKPESADAARTLKELQANLAALPKDEALAVVAAFLSSGKDQPTGLEFEINPDGTLKGWPTLRTFLLDSLLALDPATAARMSRDLLATPTTADEWALALRNIGRVETGAEANAFLRERTEALITNPAWQADPSIGYLNAFDVLVHTNATASTPLLSNLIQDKDRRDLAHAGFLTLDRLVQRQPTVELQLLAADRALQQSRPEMVAQQFARADLRDAAQQALLKSWLLDPTRTPTELRSFAGVYPNSNRFISNNLLTTESQQPGTDLAAHDRQALEIVSGWLADPAFKSVKDHLLTMVSRLNEFTGASQAPTSPTSPTPADP